MRSELSRGRIWFWWAAGLKTDTCTLSPHFALNMGLDWHHVMWESRKAHAEELLGVPAEYMYRSLCMSRNDRY